MTAAARQNPFSCANPHALATILEASQTRSIIASRDIFDLSGTKLWARDMPVSHALQRKLLDRRLRDPLESCLMAEDGITPHSLLLCTAALLERETPLSAVLRPHAGRLAEEVACLPLHPVAQLLLTAGQASRPESFDHAVQAMALAGALMLGQRGSTAEVRVAMLAGLLHDLGEMYIDPRYGEVDADRLLDFQSYQHLVVHPHVGQLLITQLTNYPASIARAIAEHHERLDGSGYPHALRREALSPLGRLLAVTEATLGVLRSDAPQLARASIALRVVPGEFDFAWVGAISAAARGEPVPQAGPAAHELRVRLARLDAALRAAEACAGSLTGPAETAPLKDALALSQYLLGRLRTGLHASGLWSNASVATLDPAEVHAVEGELLFRLHAIERAVHLRAGELPPADAHRLNLLCDSLRTVAR